MLLSGPTVGSWSLFGVRHCGAQLSRRAQHWHTHERAKGKTPVGVAHGRPPDFDNLQTHGFIMCEPGPST